MQHREVYDLTAWLSLLVACLQYDTGNVHEAEAARRAAIMLGRESGRSEVLGWGAEIKAWMALTQGDYYAALAAVREGLAATDHHPVAVQLQAQSAKAWARLGNRNRVEVTLDQGRELLESLPYPDNPRNHFQVDPAKYDFYAMDCYRNVGEDNLALAAAETVIRTSTTPAGVVISPMRLAEAELTQASVYARAGELDLAMTKADGALSRARRSLPSILLVEHEVANVMQRTHPRSLAAADFAEHLRSLESVA
jgi:tetratricopeptide (TPR) repeat protein